MHRRDHVLDGFSPKFQASPYGQWLADMYAQRTELFDCETVKIMYKALAAPEPNDLQTGMDVPVLILSGEFDEAHPGADPLAKRLPNAELKVLYDAGHACQLEKPWEFNQEMIGFLRRHGAEFLPED